MPPDARIRNVKGKNKNENVLGVLKSSKYISLFEPRQSKSEIYFEDFKTPRTFLFLFLPFTFRIRASNVVKT